VLKGWTKAAQKFSGFPPVARQTFHDAYDVMLNLTTPTWCYLGPAELDALKEKVAATRSAR
jgi:hypothetical protein